MSAGKIRDVEKPEYTPRHNGPLFLPITFAAAQSGIKINSAVMYLTGIQVNLTPDQKIEPLSGISSEITKSVVEKATGRDFKRITDCQ